jgi:hypothetical protein
MGEDLTHLCPVFGSRRKKFEFEVTRNAVVLPRAQKRSVFSVHFLGLNGVGEIQNVRETMRDNERHGMSHGGKVNM